MRPKIKSVDVINLPQMKVADLEPGDFFWIYSGDSINMVEDITEHEFRFVWWSERDTVAHTSWPLPHEADSEVYVIKGLQAIFENDKEEP